MTPGNSCKNNSSIICETPMLCHKCGWNPDVFEKRKKKQRENLKNKHKEKRGKSKWIFLSV